jgi:hypothetical protein
MKMSANKLATLFKNLAQFKIKPTQFDANTLERIGQVDHDSVFNIVKNLNDHGMKLSCILETLKNHENWMLLNRDNINEKFEYFRQMNLSSELTEHIIAGNPVVMSDDMSKIKTNLKEIKTFFTNKQMNKLIAKTPKLLTINDLSSFIYKFTYMYVLMGIKQDAMCTSLVFDFSIDHIRQRHLFLSRSGLYDKPDKHGLTKVKNPSLVDIVDTKPKRYFKTCTNGLFDQYDYEAFCNYLNQEDFTDELLGFNIGKSLRNQIIIQIKSARKKEDKDDTFQFESQINE